ncbi:MAG: carboxypeptidase regulatory-like domain-containing protein [Acidobacteriia bacterium]|nr:carboxypeptidase regulatory-like domain-containing protein [Terriglobia bacterium]
MSIRRVAQALCAAALLCGLAIGQTTTGSLLGTLTDPGDAAVPGAQIELKNTATGAVLKTTTGVEGIFSFNSLAPATYTLTVKPAAGFKTYTQSEIAVTANEVRDLGRIQLALGAVTEQISVTAVATPVQTGSSENSKLIDPHQMMDITLKGRDLFGLLVMLPGIATTQGDMTNENSINSVRINGGAAQTTNFAVDGITNLDTGSNGTTHFEPNMDSIAEMRVLTSNYQAEYGRNSSQITVVTKGGGQDFHGSGWVNKRHEMFNSNSFFRNYNRQEKSQYRFFVWGYSLGGPAYIPKVFNTSKTKLFFFVSQEYTRQKPSTQNGWYNMPTAAQRQGHFQGYTDGNGVPYNLTDPTTGAAVPNNDISVLAALNPAAAKAGQAMLNFLPLPNVCGHPGVAASGCIVDGDPTQFYARNYYWSFNESHPRRNDTVRVDYNLTSKLTSWVRYINDYDLDQTNGDYAMLNGAGQWAPFSTDHPNPGHGYGVGITYTISPTMVNEFTFGKSYNTWDYYPHDQTQLDRARMGNPPSFKDFSKDQNFVADQNKPRPTLSPGSQFFQTGIPSVDFQGNSQEPNMASFGAPCSGICPYTNWNDIYSFNDALSKVWGKHNLKAGLYFERTGKVEVDQLGAQYLGYYNFGGATAMPNNTQDGYANAFLGNFNTYREAGRVVGNYWYTDVEAFLQDNWHVSRRVTVDLGMRLYHQVPTKNYNNNTTDWIRSAYNATQAMRLYYPSCTVSTAGKACPTANQKAYDPVTGQLTFFALQGTFVPATAGGYSGTPTPYPGMVRAGENPDLPDTLWSVRTISPAFRLGIAWDVFGNGKTAIRAGLGQFLDQVSTQTAQNSSGNPPDIITRSIYYSSVEQIPNFANSAAITPIAPPGTVGKQHIQSSYNGSFMIQQKAPFETVVEASWVFNLGKHLMITRQLNAVPMYSQYNPANFNPNVAYLPPNVSGKQLSDNYFRPMQGLGALTYVNFSGNSAYNALQVSARRNMTRRLSYGLAYTFSKVMTDTRNSPYFSDKFRDYGPYYYPTPQVLAINYVYEIPNLGHKLNLRPLGWVTDHWTVSGITQFRSNRKTTVPGISFSGTTSSNPQMNWTGGYEGARMLVVGDPALPAGQASFAGPTPLIQAPGANANGTPGNQLLNESAFVIPMPCSWTASADPHYGVGQSMSCFGNAGPGNIITLPNTRMNNWDMTFSKNFPLWSEKRVIMFRAEMYNIFNHTQFTGANIGPQYNWPLWQKGTLQQTNANLGRYTSAANPRQMSMSLRLQF